MEQLEAGFAKLQGEDFEYYMQTYSIILGRNSKKSFVDVDLAGLGGGMNISRQHAKIFYDFERKGFVLEVIGKNGCYVDGVYHKPSDDPVQLDSQDLLQIGDKKFYFLLPTKKITRAPPSGSVSGSSRKRPASSGRASKSTVEDCSQPAPKRRSQPKGEGGSARVKESITLVSAGEANLTAGSSSAPGPSAHSGYHYIHVTGSDVGDGGLVENRAEPRRRVDSESELSVAVHAEDMDVLSAASTALAEQMSPGEWMPLSRLYAELTEKYSHICPPAKLQRLVPPETGNSADSDVKLKPWAGLLALLRRYPLRYIINTKLKGRITAEYVSLVAEHP